MPNTSKRKISIVGGGPAAMLCAAFLSKELYDITIYEKNKSIGRKFLVAGKGGFNLTHGEPITEMIKRYYPKQFLDKALLFFSNEKLRTWLKAIGIPTYVGSSNRIFPEKGIKPIEVLNAIKNSLSKEGVHIRYEMTWNTWGEENALIFNDNNLVESDINIFCLGGGSWKKTGSDGKWAESFANNNIQIIPFHPSNCAYQVAWQKDFIKQYSGKPLKNISVKCNQLCIKGEMVITDFGLEGNAIYALSNEIQDQLVAQGKAKVLVDLKPSLSHHVILDRLNNSKVSNTTSILKKDIKLDATQIQLLKAHTTKKAFSNPNELTSLIKNLPLSILSAADIDEAISTTGGISADALDKDFQLKAKCNNYCIGEMVDWNAPTGGYLLQAAFSMGVYLADNLNRRSVNNKN